MIAGHEKLTRSAIGLDVQGAGVTLQPNSSMNELPGRCCGSAVRKIRSYGPVILASAGALSAAAGLACTVVFAIALLVRGDGLTHGPSALGPMVLALGDPTVGKLQFGKTSPSSASPLKEAMTADAILAAYRRTVAPSAIAANISDPAETIASPTPAAAEIGKAATRDGDHLAALPEPSSIVEGNGQPLPSRTAPEVSVKSGFDWTGRGNTVAIYDISAGVVYLPDGERLEAHSGVGRMRDNPSFAHVKMLGPTPPATYTLSLREEAFHGVDAIRLTPVTGNAPFGRDGLLAHTYMLRRPGDSNGCVVFADYNRFLKAFRKKEINFIKVVPQLQDRMTELKSSAGRG